MCKMRFSNYAYRWLCETHDNEKGDRDGCLIGAREKENWSRAWKAKAKEQYRIARETLIALDLRLNDLERIWNAREKQLERERDAAYQKGYAVGLNERDEDDEDDNLFDYPTPLRSESK